MLTADAPQTSWQYGAEEMAANFEVGASRERTLNTTPDSVTYALGSRAQPSMFPTDLKPGTQLEPMTHIHLASDYTDVTIGGTNAPYLYAASHWGFEIFSLTEPAKPVRIGEIATPGRAQSVVVDGDTTYVADGAAGVHVIDITVPTDPRVIKTLGGFIDARKVQIADGNLYVLDRERGMLVYDQKIVHSVQTPRPRRFFRPGGTPINVVIHNETVYLSDDRHGLYILEPSPFGNFDFRGLVPIFAAAYEIQEKANAAYAYIASGNLTLVDITNRQNPETDFRLNTPGLATSIQLRNNIVYLTDQQSGLHIMDVRNPRQPQRIASQPTFGNATDIVIREPLAYIADGKGGIQTIDVSAAEAPAWLHRHAFGGTVYGLDIVETAEGERTVYVANGVGGMHTLEFTTPYHGTLTRRLSLPTDTLAFDNQFGAASCTKIRVRNGHGFVAAETGMFVVDLAANTIVTHIPTAAPVSDIALHGGYAYLCAESLIVVDSRAPQQSRILSERDVPGSAYRIGIDASSPSHAYVAALEGGLHIFDITAPAVLRPAGSYTTQGNATGVTLADERAYVLDSGVGVVVLDVSEPDAPKSHGVYENDALPH